MTYSPTRYFLFQIISFKKYFYVSLGNNFLLFLWRPLSRGGSMGNCPVCPIPLIRPWQYVTKPDSVHNVAWCEVGDRRREVEFKWNELERESARGRGRWAGTTLTMRRGGAKQ